jgi:hypothetical protein
VVVSSSGFKIFFTAQSTTPASKSQTGGPGLLRDMVAQIYLLFSAFVPCWLVAQLLQPVSTGENMGKRYSLLIFLVM